LVVASDHDMLDGIVAGLANKSK